MIRRVRTTIALAVLLTLLGSATASRAAVRADGAPPVNVSPPGILNEAVLGSAVTTNGGTWQSDGPIAKWYSWQACDAQGAHCTDLPNEYGPSYVPKYIQVRPGETIRVAVHAWNIWGETTAYSNPRTVRGANATLKEVPQLSGDARVGGVLTVSDGRWESFEPWTLQRSWLRCWPDDPGTCSPIPYGLGSTLLVGPLDAGWLVEGQITAKTSNGVSVATSAPVLIPGPAPLRLQTHAPDLGALVLGRDTDIVLWTGGTPPYRFEGFGQPVGVSIDADGHLVGRPSMLQQSAFQGDVFDATGRVFHDVRFDFRVIPAYVALHHLDAFAILTNQYAPTSGPCALNGQGDPQAPMLSGSPDGWNMRVGSPMRMPLVQFGAPPYAFCVLDGRLPPGLSFDPATGAIVGKPTSAGAWTVTVAVVDAAGHAGLSSVGMGFVVAPRPVARTKPKPKRHPKPRKHRHAGR